MNWRFIVVLALAVLAGVAVLFAKPTGRKQPSSAPWRGHVKPPAPPPIPHGDD